MSRGGLDFTGIGADNVTMKAADALKTAHALASSVGKAVTVTDSGEVGYGSDGDELRGAIDQYEGDDYVTVQFKGFKEFACVTTDMPRVGDIPVVNGAGLIKPSTGATGNARVWSIDSTAKTAVVLLG